jgi:hypothetical protein
MLDERCNQPIRLGTSVAHMFERVVTRAGGAGVGCLNFEAALCASFTAALNSVRVICAYALNEVTPRSANKLPFDAHPQEDPRLNLSDGFVVDTRRGPAGP